MRRSILCLGAAVALACVNAAPTSAQYLPDPTHPDAPLSIEQEEIVTRIREEERTLYLHIRTDASFSFYKKPLAGWTQSDLAQFKKPYDYYRRTGGFLKIDSSFETRAATRFFQNVFERTEGGEGGGEGED